MDIWIFLAVIGILSWCYLLGTGKFDLKVTISGLVFETVVGTFCLCSLRIRVNDRGQVRVWQSRRTWLLAVGRSSLGREANVVIVSVSCFRIRMVLLNGIELGSRDWVAEAGRWLLGIVIAVVSFVVGLR